MMRILFILSFLCVFSTNCFPHERDSVRNYWVEQLMRLSSPVIDNLSKDSLKITMPITQRQDYQYLEAFGRTFCGMSRWLNLKDDSEEEIIRATVRKKVVKCFQNGFSPDSFDYFNFDNGTQPLVDAAFIAQGLMRAPLIWNMLDEDTKSRIIEVFISLRRVKPHPNNWMLFASMIEAFILDKTGICDENRLLEGINAFIYAFYVGDGVYADGKNYDNNYYNSYVIHPMLMDILLLLQDKGLHSIHECKLLEAKRYHRYSQWMERQISETGSLPVYGRSVVYRLGMLHALAEYVCVSDSILPMGQIRTAMTQALIHQLDERDYDEHGFLKVGYNDYQPELAESYISTGSGYLCSTFFLPLGLPHNHAFWKDNAEDWTSLKLFNGVPTSTCDKAFHESDTYSILLKRYFYKYRYLRKTEKRLVNTVFLLFSILAVGGYFLCLMIYFHYRKCRI